MCVAMLCSLMACGEEEKKDDGGKTEAEMSTSVATVEDVGEASDDTQVVEEEATETAEATGYISMTPDEVVKKLEEAGFEYSYLSTNMEDRNVKTHTLEYKTEEAYGPAWVKYLEDTGELTNLTIGIQTNSEEDLEKYNELITMFFVNEADKQAFIDFVYKKDVREGLIENIEIAGISCSRQNLNVENSTERNNFKYCYNVFLTFK